MKKALIILSLLILTIVPNISAQEEYPFWALQYLKQSIEALFQGDYDKAIDQSDRVLRIDPNSSVSYTIRARAYFEKGDLEKALADCNQAARLDRNNLNAYSLRASIYAKKGILDRAISDWQTVLRIDPDNAVAIYNIELANRTITN